jgi:hypothetical protein
VAVEGADNQPATDDMSAKMDKVENNFNVYWCEGEKCG